MNHEVKEHIRNALKKGIRIDGRKLEELRPISIETGFLSTAEGSAKIIFGDAEVLAGVKMAIEKPYPDTPEDGVLMVGAELLPLSNPEFESGPPSIESIETARVIDRGIRESKAFNTKSLCLEKGEKVWTVAIDIVPLNYDGNLIDMGGLAALAALKNARFPKMNEDGTVDYHVKTDKTLELQKMPVPITVCKIGDLLIVDPTDEEEKAVDARLTVTVLDDDKICALQKGGDSPLTMKDIEKMVDLAIKTSKVLRSKIVEVN
ncbi:exosome complex protein Rrp42 [Candidatus Woesearchaeota archaeon]|nr:exosome complex protein Rrp42 [Candidatus Woesearchaeota archaeon]